MALSLIISAMLLALLVIGAGLVVLTLRKTRNKKINPIGVVIALIAVVGLGFIPKSFHTVEAGQIAVVKQTLTDIGAGDKPTFLVFNKIDAYTYTPKEEDDLTPITKENLSLDDLKKSWIAKANTPCIFISAREKLGVDKLRNDLYGMVREIHAGRYPFNNFLY